MEPIIASDILVTPKKATQNLNTEKQIFENGVGNDGKIFTATPDDQNVIRNNTHNIVCLVNIFTLKYLNMF